LDLHISSDHDLEDQKQASPQLCKQILNDLVDGALRCSIACKPLRLAPGIRVLHGIDDNRLCNRLPAVFVPQFAQQIQDRAGLISGIATLLTKFVDSHCPTSQESSSIDGTGTPSELSHRSRWLEQRLFSTTTEELKFGDAARRLPPLRTCPTTGRPYLMLNMPRSVDGSVSKDGKGEEAPGAASMSSHADMIELSIDDVCHRCDLEIDGGVHHPNLIGPSSPPSSVWEELQTYGDVTAICNLHQAFDGRELLDDNKITPHTESRKHSLSLSRTSDVSMLCAREGPINREQRVDCAPSIGGSDSLTQNVIRMHPLRQQSHSNGEQLYPKRSWQETNVYQIDPEHCWWSDTDFAKETPLQDLHALPIDLNLIDNDLSIVLHSDEDSDHEDAALEQKSSSFDDLFCNSTDTTPMNQGDASTNASLSDVIGNDHLLWHMWKRRQSVAPRGQEDVIDMNKLFANDPDMKLFSSRWDLDPEDTSPGSSEDTTPQEDMTSPSDLSPKTPGSERRRSYFGPARTTSSSSSSYVGRPAPDSKRKSSLVKRFTWGGRQSCTHEATMDMPKRSPPRHVEIKKRRTLADYDTMEREARDDESGDMLF
jgi:hypothetical protein